MKIPKQESWQQRAATHQAQLYAEIPAEWRLKDDELELASQQRDIRGSFIERFLSDEEVAVTGLTACDLAERLQKGRAGGGLTAAKVTRAFCHRAGVGQQIVSQHASSWLSVREKVFWPGNRDIETRWLGRVDRVDGEGGKDQC